MTSALDSEIDALFVLPLDEFTAARNALAARLKKEVSKEAAERVKLLAKPSVSAWAVNQVYWNHRTDFDELLATSERLFSAQASVATNKAAHVREAVEARRHSLSNLSDLATQILEGAGHSPSQDTLRRVTTTLESLSTYAMLPDGPEIGRLTQDVDPPSFESMAALISGMPVPASKPAPPPKPAPVRKSAAPTPKKSDRPEATDAREIRQAKIAAAKGSLKEARESLAAARASAQSREAALKRANADLRAAEDLKRAAEERLQRAASAVDEASDRAQSADQEAQDAARSVEDSKLAVEQATKLLESLMEG